MKRYFKAFRVGELFTRKVINIKQHLKYLDISPIKINKDYIAVVTESSKNNGVVGYIDRTKGIDLTKVQNGEITLATQFGSSFVHDYDFVVRSDNLSTIIELKKGIITERSRYFLSVMIEKVFKTKHHNYNRKITAGNDFNREIILLPVIQCNPKDAIWTEEDGTHLTLDVETIKDIMDKVEERKKERTINLYEAEKVKYETEKVKYETEKVKYETDSEFMSKYNEIVFKSFKVGDLFERTHRHAIKTAIKKLETSDKKDGDFKIANVTGKGLDNGIHSYLKDEGEVSEAKKSGFLTTTTSGMSKEGVIFYHDYDFVSSGHNSMIEVKDSKLKELLDKNKEAYYYLSLITTKMFFGSGFFNRAFTVNKGNNFNREIILLPVHNDEIQADVMAYLYNLIMIRKQENKIENYNNKIKQIKGED